MRVFAFSLSEISRRITTFLACVGTGCFIVLALTLVAPSAHSREEAACGPTVTVARGDTLSKIARRCGVTVPAMLRANPQIRNPNIVPLGSVLKTTREATAEVKETPVESTGAIAISPSGDGAGGRIAVTASGLPPRVRVWIKGGRGQSPKHHLVLGGARTNADGELHTTVRLPRLSKSAQTRYRLSVEVPRTGITLLSQPLESHLGNTASKTP